MEKKQIREVPVYTAQRSVIAEMLIEKLSSLGIPARLGNDSDAAGVFAVPSQSRTIWVLQEHSERAKEILNVK